MSRKSRRKQNAIVKQRRLDRLAVAHVLRLEPVIRVHDRRDNYYRRRQSNVIQNLRAERRISPRLAPRRLDRKLQASVLETAFGREAYRSWHNCKREWGKLLSWRSGQGAGRKRSQHELQNNRESFNKKDC